MNKNEFSIVNVESKTAVSIRGKSSADKLQLLFDELFNELGNLVKSQGLQVSSPAFSICYDYSNGFVDIEAGLPVSGSPVPEGRVNVIQTYKGKTVTMNHYGTYGNLHESWNLLEEYVKENNLKILSYPFEVYVIGPFQERDSSKWLTKIYFPIL